MQKKVFPKKQEKIFYIDKIIRSLTSVSDDKLKAIAEGIIMIIEAVK